MSEHEHENGHDEDEQEDEHEHDHLDEQDVEEALEEALELDTQSQIFLEMRRQNVDLLKIAAEVAGYSGSRSALKPGEVRNALRNIWEIFAEFYTWVDPEESDDDDLDDDEDDEDDDL